MTLRKVLTLSLAAATLAGAAPAFAQLDPLTDPLPRVLGETSERRLDRVEQTLREMRAILFQGRDTGRPVVVQPAETQGQVNIIDNRVVDLQQTLLTINSQLDTLSADIAALRREATTNATTLRNLAQADAATNARIDALQKSITDQAAAAAAAAANPETAFANAMQLYMDGQITPAADAFAKFVADHPTDVRTAEANFYLGESRFKQADYNRAALAYIGAIGGYPATSWAPSAMVKLAQSLIETNHATDACGVLNELNTRYPNASAALKTEARTQRTRARCA